MRFSDSWNRSRTVLKHTREMIADRKCMLLASNSLNSENSVHKMYAMSAKPPANRQNGGDKIHFMSLFAKIGNKWPDKIHFMTLTSAGGEGLGLELLCHCPPRASVSLSSAYLTLEPALSHTSTLQPGLYHAQMIYKTQIYPGLFPLWGIILYFGCDLYKME